MTLYKQIYCYISIDEIYIGILTDVVVLLSLILQQLVKVLQWREGTRWKKVANLALFGEEDVSGFVQNENYT